jgi:hypothetical protein
MAVTSPAVPSWEPCQQHPGSTPLHCTADTEKSDYINDPTEAQLTGLIGGLGQASGAFITINPADDSRVWYASVSLLPDGTLEIERADPRPRRRPPRHHR